MVNFTNLRSKALSLVALMALSSTAVFAQNPYGDSEFRKATKEANLTKAKKIFLYDGTTDKYSAFPFDSNAGLVKGVSLAVQKTIDAAIVPATGYFNEDNDGNVGDLAFNPIAQESPNDLYASYWYNNSKMNVFTRQNAATVVFDFSTKNLRNVRDLKITLGENRMGSTPSLTTDWTLTTYVYDMSGNPVPVSEIYKSQTGNATSFSLGTVITTGTTDGVADKTITLFVNDKDNNTVDLIPFAIDNKIIRVVLTSKVPEATVVGGHFLPALTISNCGIEFEKPSLSVAVNAWDFNSGACGTSKQTGKLTVVAKNLTGVAENVIKGYASFANTNKPLADFAFAQNVNNVVAPEVTFESDYVYKPLGIETGTFSYVASVNANGTDNLSPIKLIATHEKAIAYDSEPVVTLAEDHVKFDGPREVKTVTITGKNVPVYNFASGKMLDYQAYEKKSSDQRVKYADLEVTEIFDIATNGDIVKTTGATPLLNLAFNQTINDISRDEAFLVSAQDWTVTLCDNEEYTGAKFQTLIARGNVAQLWFTYAGKTVIGTSSITPDNVFFSRHDASQPYDDARYASRVKKFMLHGSDVTAKGDDKIAKILVNLEVGDLNTAGQDHLEMRFSLKDPASEEFAGWTNATIKTLEIPVNTSNQADLENLLIKGIPVYVQYVPRCDGFTVGATAEADYSHGWNPHEFVLSAKVNDNGVSTSTETTVNLYGDTRAVLASSMNDINSLYVMGGTQSVSPIGGAIKDWMFGASVDNIIFPSFRKSYGDMYLGCENNLYWKVDSFMVAGYNLKDKVKLVQTHNTTAYQNAFSTEVTMLAGSTTDGATLKPNDFGELVAVVKVYFAKNTIEKKDKAVKAEDVLTVTTAEKTLVISGQDKRTEVIASKVQYLTDKAKDYYTFFKVGADAAAHKAINGFNYKAYTEAAEVFGFIYKPTLAIQFTDTKDMTAAIGGNQVSKFWVRGSEFNPMNGKAVTVAVENLNTSFAVAPVAGAATINGAGSFAAEYTLTYAPTKANNLCIKENSVILSTQCANAVTEKVTGIPTWNKEAEFDLKPLNFGDIHGSMAKISWTAMPGADWYQVQVGHWKPKFTSEDVFISECKAAVGSDQIFVEVFNGTGKEINKNMMVNYYLTLEQTDLKTGKVVATTPVKGVNLDNSLLNTNATKEGWNDDAVVYVFNAPINDNYNYNVKLMQGGVQMDIFSFGQAGAHLSRTAAVTRDADGKIIAATTIKRNTGAFDQAAWETFRTSLPLAHYEWRDYTSFDMLSDGGFSAMIEKTSTTINNLKPNRDYDVCVVAYNDCIVDAEGVKIPTSTPQKMKFLNMSQYTAGEGDITFSDEGEWPTNNGTITASSVTVYANDGKIFVAGAEGNVVICNVLGASVATATAEAAQNGIAVSEGIYVVRVNNEKGVKCIVK